jgi:hypothetical protein
MTLLASDVSLETCWRTWNLHFLPWARRLQVLPKHIHLSTKLHDVASHLTSAGKSSIKYRTFQSITAYINRENILSQDLLRSRISLKVCVWTCKTNYSLSHNYAETRYASDRQTLPASYKKCSVSTHVKHAVCVSESIIFSASQNFLSYYFYATLNLQFWLMIFCISSSWQRNHMTLFLSCVFPFIIT